MAVRVKLVKRVLKARKRNGQHEYRWTLRWEDPDTGKRACESTGTADRTQAETLQKIKWAELNGLAGAPPTEPEPVAAPPAATWQDCRDTLERAIVADNLRGSSANDYLLTFDGLHRMFPEAASPATKACELAGWKNGEWLSTLAAAYAELGDFKKAVVWQTKALEVASPDEADALKGQLMLYQGRRPYRQANP
jgi:tetratricopeptide (TPR) repeat protein